MRTIAISRLVGSEGANIARRVTEALGYTLLNKSTLEGIFRQYGHEKFGDLYTSPPNIWDLANAKNLQIVSMLNDTMEALAHRGNMLILGRGGYASLSKYEDVLNVRLQAPFLVRVDRVLARKHLDNRLRAEQRVKADDTARQNSSRCSTTRHGKTPQTSTWSLIPILYQRKWPRTGSSKQPGHFRKKLSGQMQSQPIAPK